MIEEWYLLVTLFVLQPNGIVDERNLYSVKQESHFECELEANARIQLFTPQLGGNTLRRFTTGYRSCGFVGCKSPNYDKGNGTYEIGLTGTFVGFKVGCEKRETIDWKEWDRLPETREQDDKRKDPIHSL